MVACGTHRSGRRAEVEQDADPPRLVLTSNPSLATPASAGSVIVMAKRRRLETRRMQPALSVLICRDPRLPWFPPMATLARHIQEQEAAI